MRKIPLVLLTVFLYSYLSAQPLQQKKLSVFLDCRCPLDYLKQELPVVDFIRDNVSADLHILVTDQNNGGGGESVQMIFFGQNKFARLKDTIHFNTAPTATEFENRDVLLKYLKIGLLPYLAKTSAIANINIDILKVDSSGNTNTLAQTTDKWNYWTFNVGLNGSIDGDKVYKGTRIRGDLSADRVTNDIKINFRLNANQNKTTYHIEDPNGIDPTYTFVNNNHSVNFYHRLVKSFNKHFSYGYSVNIYNSTFSNYKLKYGGSAEIEYNVFPYSESTTKLLTFRYYADISNNRYIDTTLYGKLRETLPGQGLKADLSFTQKWGSSSIGLSAHNYFINQWKYFNVGFRGNINVRITGGLSFNTGVFAGISRDQLNISGENASQQDILSRRRQIGSNYNYSTYFGINYRFGSKLNTFVNPRFDGGD